MEKKAKLDHETEMERLRVKALAEANRAAEIRQREVEQQRLSEQQKQQNDLITSLLLKMNQDKK